MKYNDYEQQPDKSKITALKISDTIFSVTHLHPTAFLYHFLYQLRLCQTFGS